MFELKSGNQNVHRQMDRQMDGCRTHQSNRQVGYTPSDQKSDSTTERKDT